MATDILFDDDIDLLRAALPALPKLQRAVVLLRIGQHGEPGRTTGEVGYLLGMLPAEVRQLVDDAKRKVRAWAAAERFTRLMWPAASTRRAALHPEKRGLDRDAHTGCGGAGSRPA